MPRPTTVALIICHIHGRGGGGGLPYILEYQIMASVTVAYATFITGNPRLHLYMYILYSNHNPRILIMRVILIYICILTPYAMYWACIVGVVSPAPGIKPPLKRDGTVPMFLHQSRCRISPYYLNIISHKVSYILESLVYKETHECTRQWSRVACSRRNCVNVKNERNLIENKETYLPCHGYSDRSVCTCRIFFLTPFYSFYT